MSVHKKILEVMKDIEYLQKDDDVAFGNTRYKGLSEEKVTGTVRASLVKHGLIVFPVAQVHHREPIGEKTAMLSTVDVTYRFVDTEDDSFIEVVSSGTGVDTQDKGVGKAMTYCYKYLFLRTFSIPTGEDPDKTSSAELDDKEAKARIEKGKKTIRQDVEDYQNILDGGFIAEITANTDVAKTVEDVTTIYRSLKKEIKRYEMAESKARGEDAFAGMKKASEIDGKADGDLGIF